MSLRELPPYIDEPDWEADELAGQRVTAVIVSIVAGVGAIVAAVATKAAGWW